MADGPDGGIAVGHAKFPADAVDDAVIRALTLPAVLPGKVRKRSRKLDVGELYDRLSSTGLVFAFSSMDDRGRLRNRSIFEHLQWSAGCRLGVTLGRNYLLLRPDESGDLAVDGRSRLLLAANLLHYCGVEADRQVLLIAASEHRMLVVHPARNMAEMVRLFYLDQVERTVYGSESHGRG